MHGRLHGQVQGACMHGAVHGHSLREGEAAHARRACAHGLVVRVAQHHLHDLLNVRLDVVDARHVLVAHARVRALRAHVELLRAVPPKLLRQLLRMCRQRVKSRGHAAHPCGHEHHIAWKREGRRAPRALQRTLWTPGPFHGIKRKGYKWRWHDNERKWCKKGQRTWRHELGEA